MTETIVIADPNFLAVIAIAVVSIGAVAMVTVLKVFNPNK